MTQNISSITEEREPVIKCFAAEKFQRALTPVAVGHRESLVGPFLVLLCRLHDKLPLVINDYTKMGFSCVPKMGQWAAWRGCH